MKRFLIPREPDNSASRGNDCDQQSTMLIRWRENYYHRENEDVAIRKI